MKRGHLLVLFSVFLYNINGGCMNNYLIVSESFRLIADELEQIIGKNTNIIKYDMQNVTIFDLINEAAYMSLLDEPKFIIATNANFFGNIKLKEEESEYLINYLVNPNKNTTIIFTTNKKLDERKKITKFMRNQYKVIDIPKLNEFDMNKKVSNIFKKNNYNIEFDAVRYITSSCLNNYDLIYNEIAKIKLCYTEKKDLTLEDIKKLVFPSIEDNVFKLINAIVTKDHKLARKYFNDLKILKEEPIAFIALLAREYRNMYLIKTLGRTKSKEDLLKIMNIQNWQYEKHEKNAYQYDEQELKEKLKELYDLDCQIKMGKIDKYFGFELFLLNN